MQREERLVDHDSLFADVPVYVSELVGDAQSQSSPVNALCRRLRLRSASHDRDAHQSNSSRDVIAIKIEFVEVLISWHVQIDSHSFDHVPERLQLETRTLLPSSTNETDAYAHSRCTSIWVGDMPGYQQGTSRQYQKELHRACHMGSLQRHPPASTPTCPTLLV